jgi:hypothetical protein
MLAQCLNRCPDSPFGDDLAGLIKDAKLAVAITDVETNSVLGLGMVFASEFLSVFMADPRFLHCTSSASK